MATKTQPTGPLADLTAFQRDILTVVAYRGDPHGLAIKEVLQNRYDEEINHGRLYPNLDQLVDQGLIEKGTKDRRTNSYELTERARDQLSADVNWRAAALELSEDDE